MGKVTLKKGGIEDRSVIITVMQTLHELNDDNDASKQAALNELVELCRDQRVDLNKDTFKILKSLGLIWSDENQKPALSRRVKNIVLSSVTGIGPDMRLDTPIKKAKLVASSMNL